MSDVTVGLESLKTGAKNLKDAAGAIESGLNAGWPKLEKPGSPQYESDRAELQRLREEALDVAVRVELFTLRIDLAGTK